MANMREVSKADWLGPTTNGSINTGSLQRIADACEKMAVNWASLSSERDQYKRWYEKKRTECEASNRSIAALRGQITKLKKGAAS